MEKAHIKYLLDRRYVGTITPQETAELQQLVNDPAWQPVVEAAIEDLLAEPSLQHTMTEEQSSNVLARILQLPQKEVAPVRSISFMRRWGWVAAAVLVIATGLLYYTMRTGPDHTQPVVAVTEIKPGKEGALLTLIDGSQVSLDTIKNGVVALQGGIKAKVVEGALVYEGKAAAMAYNAMTTPKGREFQLELPDGSRVWLNAASSIRYPLAFNGADRTVTITGEAYFEVAKSTKPFRVLADGRAEIKVLGTHFNVNAYANEGSLNTTLLEGSVQVIRAGEQTIIQPGQQARVAQQISVMRAVNLDQVMAWKNGLFNFEGMDLRAVMRQLERWYDIEVVYERGVPDLPLTGELSKDVTLNGLLTGLQELGLQYRLEGKTLIITQ